ncbi:hypothetical protein ACPA9J_03595 [Pseudomonas aeruginosa]
MDDVPICLHDLASWAGVDGNMRRALVAFALAFVERDAEWVVDAWLDLGLLGDGTDRAVFVPVVRALVARLRTEPAEGLVALRCSPCTQAAGRTQEVRPPRDLLVAHAYPVVARRDGVPAGTRVFHHRSHLSPHDHGRLRRAQVCGIAASAI